MNLVASIDLDAKSAAKGGYGQPRGGEGGSEGNCLKSVIFGSKRGGLGPKFWPFWGSKIFRPAILAGKNWSSRPHHSLGGSFGATPANFAWCILKPNFPKKEAVCDLGCISITERSPAGAVDAGRGR